MTIAEKLTAIAENEQKVYDAGKQAEYDAFWDSYQENGSRTDYTGGFAGRGWTSSNFNPKYPLQPLNAGYMFYNAHRLTFQTPDVVDFSKCTSFASTFMSGGTYIDLNIDCSSASVLNQTFAWSGLTKRVKKLIVHENLTFSNTFNQTSKLEEIEFEGVIGNSISFAQSSKLSLESAKSILSNLKDFTGTDNELTRTVTLHADTWALLDADGATSPTGTTWAEYVTAKRWNM